MLNHREAGEAEPRRGVGDTVSGVCAGIIGSAVVKYLHWPQVGNGVSGGGADPYIRIMYMGEGTQGGGGRERK